MNDRKAPEPGFQIPDLDLGPPVSKRAAQPSPPQSRAASTAQAAAFGLEISLPDLDDEDEQLLQKGSNLELSSGTSPQAAKRHREQWPHGHTRPVDQLAIDAAEVTLTAGYGPAPQSALWAPWYAYRVLSRRSPLKQAVALRGAELAAAELARDTQLVQLADQLRPLLEGSDVFRRVLEPIREVERLAGERSAALSQADTGYREQMARFDAELLQLQDSAAKAQAIYEETSSAAAATENELRRAEAKQQRLQIEIRGVLEVARQALGPEGGDLPPAQASKLAELQARAVAGEPEQARFKAAHEAAETAQDQAQSELRRAKEQIRRVERQKASAASPLEKQLSVRAANVSEAEQRRREALADLGRAVLAAHGALAVPEPLLLALREHDQSVEALAIRLETHVRALDSYERARVKQGIILVLSAFGMVVLSILLKAML